jgi:hypothetical protein
MGGAGASAAAAPEIRPPSGKPGAVHDLSAALADDDSAVAREQVRALVDAIVLIPEADDLRIEVRGELERDDRRWNHRRSESRGKTRSQSDFAPGLRRK